MIECPQCHQKVDSRAVSCPYCRATLKAYGHPGIPLHRATGEESLCTTCTYHQDDTCNFPQRPYAKECTLYQDFNTRLDVKNTPTPQKQIQFWVKQNLLLVIIIALILISLALSL